MYWDIEEIIKILLIFNCSWIGLYNYYDINMIFEINNRHGQRMESAETPPIRRALLGGNFLGFFREFSGKFRVFREISGIFRNFQGNFP